MIVSELLGVEDMGGVWCLRRFLYIGGVNAVEDCSRKLRMAQQLPSDLPLMLITTSNLVFLACSRRVPVGRSLG